MGYTRVDIKEEEEDKVYVSRTGRKLEIFLKGGSGSNTTVACSRERRMSGVEVDWDSCFELHKQWYGANLRGGAAECR